MDKFVEKRILKVPTEEFVEIELSAEEARKVHVWIKAGDRILVCGTCRNAIILINETKHKCG